jgi:hypothetical protein
MASWPPQLWIVQADLQPVSAPFMYTMRDSGWGSKTDLA